jgi:predicted PurR-regulated permease PerM
MRREHLFAAFFFLVLAYLLYQFYLILHYFVGPLTWAALLALIFQPLQRWLTQLLRDRDGLAAFLLTTTVILVVIVPTIYLTVVLATQSADLYQEVKSFVEAGRVSALQDQLRASVFGRLWERLAPAFAAARIDLPALTLKTTNVVSVFLVSQAPQAAANVVRFVANIFFTTFALFFFFRDGERMVGAFRDLIPMEPEHKDAVLRRLYDTVSAVVQGNLVTAAVQGLLAGIGIAIVGVPFAILLGVATSFVSLLPFGGPLVWVSVAIYLLIGGEYARAAILVAWGVIVVSSADNVIRPLIIGGRTQIPTVFLFFGILGGLQAYGFLGIFLGPALIAILVAFLRIYREEYATAAGPPPV